jgi:class 3 adenylate cyclase
MAFCTACGAARPGRAGQPPARIEDRRRVSVLFVDLIDSTPLVERADPEQFRETQTGFFTAVRRVVGQYGGVVEKYIGDAVMVLFGAPIATETDAVRCVRAGLEVQRVLARYAPADAGGLRFRVGVATGEALVDVTAARDGGQAIVAGDVVHTASRLQSVAPPGGVLVCGTTYVATKGAIHYAEQPPVTLRGHSRPTEVWLALGARQRTQPDREADATPLVNRHHELSLLVNALHRALGDRVPQLITILGRAGIGKSRLVLELYQHSERLLDTTVCWRTGRCPPFGENVTYAALADIVKAQAGILDTDSAETARDRLGAALRFLVEPDEAARLCDALSPLVGLTGTQLAADELESAWRRFVVALASRQPTVLVFEDLHWADESMLRFVELLSGWVREVPLLLLCTARPELVEREPSFASGAAGAMTITLPPLRSTEIATMYAHLFGQATFPPDVLDPLVELADGNPLYAHEYTRMLIEQGALRPSGGPSGAQWRLESGEDLPMPDSVHAVIANRVDLLEPIDRTVLQAAAVVGMQFWPGAVAAALARPVDAIERSLRRLEKRDLIHEQASSTMAGQPEYRFGHVLVRDVCYQRLPRTERVARHERTADWLDSVSASRATDLAEVLAHHRYTAHEIARTLGVDASRYAPAAREALHRAARRAYALHALGIAAVHVGRALSLCTDESAATERMRLELFAAEIGFYASGEAFLTGGGTDQLTELAERLYTAGEPGQAARAWTLLGQVAWLRADRPTALSYLDHALELFDDLPDTQEKAEAYAELGRLHMLNYEHDPAVAAATIAVEIADRLGLAEIAANARITMGMARYNACDRAGLTDLHAAMAQSRPHLPLTLRRAIQNVAYTMWEEGDWAGSQAMLEEGRSVEVPGVRHLSTGFSLHAQGAHFAGDWNQLMAEAAEPGEWDLQGRALRAWIGVLRSAPDANRPATEAPDADHPDADHPDADPAAEPDEVALLVSTSQRSGFHRLLWNALAHGALCRALCGRLKEATELLDELAGSWRRIRALTSGEWIDAAAYAGALVGREGCIPVRDMLAEVGHRTPWVEAAARTVTAGLATADGDACRAAEMHFAAAEIYDAIPNVTYHTLSLAMALRALGGAEGLGGAEALGGAPAGMQARAQAARTAVRVFADRNRAPGLLALAGLEGGPPPGPVR